MTYFNTQISYIFLVWTPNLLDVIYLTSFFFNWTSFMKEKDAKNVAICF